MDDGNGPSSYNGSTRELRSWSTHCYGLVTLERSRQGVLIPLPVLTDPRLQTISPDGVVEASRPTYVVQ